MSYDNIVYSYNGFIPEKEARFYVENIGKRIRQLSPSDSIVNLALKKCRGAIEVSCRVVSRSGNFVANAVGQCPQKAIENVEKRIKWQLASWKQKRFKDRELSSKEGATFREAL